MGYYIITVTLIIACVIYDACKMFSKPTVIDCGEYTVKSKDKKELFKANMIQHYHYNVAPYFEEAFKGNKEMVYAARNAYIDIYKARNGFVPFSAIQKIHWDVLDMFDPPKPLGNVINYEFAGEVKK